MMIQLFCWFIHAKLDISISSDGRTLSFSGDGTIDQALARSKGSYKSIQNIFIDGSIILGEGAFMSFSSLEKAELSDLVTEIKSMCFKDCTSLLEFSFPNSVSAINSETFRGCSSLHTVRINSSIQVINNYLLFFACRSLAYFDVSLNNQMFSTDDSHQYLMSKNGSILYSASAAKDQIYPSSIQIVHSYCYYSMSYTSIDFSKSSLKRIMTRSFAQLTINSLIFPSTLEQVDGTSFYQSTISILSFPSSLKYFDKNALTELNRLTNMIVEDSEALIKKNGLVMDAAETMIYFIDSNITNIILSDTIEYIEPTRVRSQKVMSIEANSSFYSSYDGVLYNSAKTSLIACPGGKTEVEVYSGCQSTSATSFLRCLVQKVKLNEGLISIGSQSFSYCYDLISINIPSTLKIIYGYSFRSTTSLEIDIKFGCNITNVDSYAFSTSSVTSLDFSECSLLLSLSANMLHNCKAKTVILPPNLKSCNEYSFISSSISEIKFSSQFSLLGIVCFMNCANLKDVNLINTQITNIPDSCFEGSGVTSI